MRTAARVALLLACAALPLPSATAQTALANPASKNCLDQGGFLSIEKDGSGGQFGVCHFEDNRQCEEWALLRGECPAGGIKLTGYTTPAARYCALRGGRYQLLSGSPTAVEQGRCSFGRGSGSGNGNGNSKACAALAFFNGLCTPDGAGETVHAVFRCDAGRTVDALFSNGTPASVSLVLSDGRALALPQALSGSGARYADAGERFVFWNKGLTAFIDEGGRTTYAGCSTPR